MSWLCTYLCTSKLALLDKSTRVSWIQNGKNATIALDDFTSNWDRLWLKKKNIQRQLGAIFKIKLLINVKILIEDFFKLCGLLTIYELYNRSKLGMLGNGILFPKLFWPTVRKNCSRDQEKLFFTVGLNNLCNKIPFPNMPSLLRFIKFIYCEKTTKFEKIFH